MKHHSRNVLFTKSNNLFAGCQRPCPIAVCVSSYVCATHTHTVVSTSAERTSITLPSLPALLSPGVCSRRSCNTVYCVAGHCQTAVSVPGHTYERTDTGEHSPDPSCTHMKEQTLVNIALICFSVLQATESWVGPGNEAKLHTYERTDTGEHSPDDPSLQATRERKGLILQLMSYCQETHC